MRNALLHHLEINFGDQRIKELSKFLLMYIQQQLDSPDPYTRDSVKVQKWIALAYFHPNIVARDLASALRVSLE